MKKLFLIVEDQTDAEVIKVILDRQKRLVKVEPLPPGALAKGKSQGSIHRRADQIEELIKTAISRRETGDCITVLHDADEYTRSDDGPYRKIADVCKKYEDDVLLLIAHDEL